MTAKPLLFLSSYAPLFGLLAIRFTNWRLTVACAALAALGIAAVLLLVKLDARTEPGPHRIMAVRDAGPEAAAYLASYLLPFLTVAEPTLRDIVAYAAFVLVAAAVHLRSSIVQVNPLFYLLGYRILAIDDENGLRAYLATRSNPTPGHIIYATRFKDNVLLERQVSGQVSD